jgi:hypothetical protein
MAWRAGWIRALTISAVLFTAGAGCGGSTPTAPEPVLQTETFTGTLQPLGVDFKTFMIVYAQGPTNLSVAINSLTTVEGSTPVTGITIGVGLGTVSGTACALQLQTPAATLGQELLVPNGASAGTYCVQIFDCPTGSTGCTSTLTEAVTYSMVVRHY